LIEETDNRTYYLIERQGMYQVSDSLYGKDQVFENIKKKDQQEVEALATKFLTESGT